MPTKMATIVGDVTGFPRRHHPQNIPHLVKKIKGFPLKVKSFQNTATYRKLRGEVPSKPPPPPPPPRTTVGVWICLFVRGLTRSLVQLLSIIRKRYRRRSFNIFTWLSFTFSKIHFRKATICDVNFICILMCIITQLVVVQQYGGKNFLTSRENDLIDLV